MSDRPDIWRRSALEAAACLHRYAKVYLEGVDESSDPNRRGRAFHAAAELYVRKLLTCRMTADIDLAREAFTDALELELLPSHLIPDTEMLFFRWAENFELELDCVLVVEETLVTELTSADGQTERFTWRPDLVYAKDDALEIWDWKSHYAAHTEAQAQRELQGLFYLLMAMVQWPGFRRYRFFYRYVRLGLTVPARGLELRADDVPAVERRIFGAVAVLREAIRRQEFPAMSGPHCGFCRLDCPINATRGRMPVRVDSAQQFAALANEYVAIGRRYDLIGEVLKQHVAAEGPQVVNGMRFQLKPIEKASYPLDQVLAMLDSHGIDLPPDTTIAKTSLGPLANPKKYPSVAADLEAIKQVETTFRFDAKKDGEQDEVA